MRGQLPWGIDNVDKSDYRNNTGVWGGGKEEEARETVLWEVEKWNEVAQGNGTIQWGKEALWMVLEKKVEVEELKLSKKSRVSSLKYKMGIDSTIILEEKWDTLNPGKE